MRRNMRLIFWIGWVYILMAIAAWGQNRPEPVFVPGEMLLTTRPGVLVKDVRAMAESVNADSESIGVPDTYLLKLRQTGLSAEELKAKVNEAVNNLKENPNVKYIRPHWQAQLHDNPNDTRYSEQWALRNIRMPQAWDIIKNSPTIRVAVIDDSFNTNHEDVVGQYDTDLTRDFTINPPSENVLPPAGAYSHGTNTSSIIIARANNNLGIAGMCGWIEDPNIGGMKVIGCKIGRNPNLNLDGAALLRAYQHLVDNSNVVDSINMSYGGFFLDPQERDLLQTLHDRGVSCIASAGNFNIDINTFPTYPACHPFVLSISATGPDNTKAGYSNFGKVEMTAPGGAGTGFTSATEVLMAGNQQLYEASSGTSFASPHVAGAAGLLRAIGVPKGQVNQVLIDSANRLGQSVVPGPQFGYGLLDVEAALRGAAGVSASIIEPVRGTTTDTRVVLLRAVFRRVKDNSAANITITVNNQEVPREQWQNLLTFSAPNRILTLNGLELQLVQGDNQIVVVALGDEEGKIATASTSVSVVPYRQYPGLAMFSVPYIINQTPEELFGVNVAMARWIVDEGNSAGGYYARYFGNGAKDPQAGFSPVGTGVRPVGGTTDTPPRGLGYFLNSDSEAFILGDALLDTNISYIIPLQPGWNMIGNPFPFAVDWAACEIETTGFGGITKRVSIAQAIDDETIKAQIFRYVPLSAQYTWRTAPLGQLLPFQSHWIRVLKPCMLIVPPLGSRDRSAKVVEPSRVAPSAQDGWMMRLTVRSGNLEDSNNFIGVSRSAEDRVSREDVEKPPYLQNFVNLRIMANEGRSALAQDLRKSDRRAQKWNLEVTTDQNDAEMTLQWSQELKTPAGMRLTLVDTLTGARISMNKQSAYTFRAGNGTSRQFVVEAQPANRNQLRLTNVDVVSTRGNAHTIRYGLTDQANVQVQIMSASGKPLARLSNATRSAGVNSVTWNGRTDEGVALPAGTYNVQITATTEDGAIARVVRPLVLTR